jgi:hypothetical protein
MASSPQSVIRTLWPASLSVIGTDWTTSLSIATNRIRLFIAFKYTNTGAVRQRREG